MNNPSNKMSLNIQADSVIKQIESIKNSEYFISSNSISSLQLHEFDLTWAHRFVDDKTNIVNVVEEWKKDYNYKFINNMHVFDTTPIERVYKKYEHIDVKYYYNNYFFRCDNFIKDHDGLHVLFSGCSNTEGMGLPVELTWTKLLLEQINKITKTSGHFNLAKSGNGWQKIIHNFKIYVNKYGAPDYFFVLLPNLLRDYYWDDDRKVWSYTQTMPLNMNQTLTKDDKESLNTYLKKHPDKESQIKFYDLDNYLDRFPLFVIFWSFLENYCKTIGTKLVYSTWDLLESINLQNAKDAGALQNFVAVDNKHEGDLDKYLFKNPHEKHPLFLEARDGHPGILQHQIWSDQLFENIKDDIMGQMKK